MTNSRSGSEELFADGDDERRYVLSLTADDRIRVVTAVRGGVVVKLAVQLECRIRGRWVELRRYDTAHPDVYGPLHLHLAPWSKRRDVRRAVPIRGNLHDVIDSIIDDLVAQWWDVRTAYEQGLKR